MNAPFAPSRDNGMSDREVVFDLVRSAKPETLFSYPELVSALEKGLDKEVARGRVCAAARGANKLLLHEHNRYLRVVAGVGYRMIPANEHLPVALGKKSSAERYLRAGRDVLQHCRLEDLDENQRALHQGQLLIIAGVYQMARSSEKRHKRQEQVVDDLKKRIETLEEAAHN